MKIFTKENIFSAFKKALFFVFALTVISLMINFDQTLSKLDWQDFFWKQTFTFVLIFIVYFLTENYKDLSWKDLGKIFTKNKTN